MSKTAIAMHCIQYVIFAGAGLVTGIEVFDSGAMALYLILLSIFISNISFYVETIAKGKYI